MRHVKAGTLDLTASTMFIKCVEMHAHVGACARELNRTFPFGSGKLNAGSAVETLLRTLHGMHSLWAKKEDLNPADLASYRQRNVLVLCGVPPGGKFPPGYIGRSVIL